MEEGNEHSGKELKSRALTKGQKAWKQFLRLCNSSGSVLNELRKRTTQREKSEASNKTTATSSNANQKGKAAISSSAGAVEDRALQAMQNLQDTMSSFSLSPGVATRGTDSTLDDDDDGEQKEEDEETV
jgi:hypothetical protein